MLPSRVIKSLFHHGSRRSYSGKLISAKGLIFGRVICAKLISKSLIAPPVTARLSSVDGPYTRPVVKTPIPGPKSKVINRSTH